MAEHVNPVHQLYMDLSGRYRAGWTFHRFIQGLQKFFGGRDLEDHTADFQELYGELREASKRLNDPEIRPVVSSLENLQGKLDELLAVLDREDRQVDPSLVRLFFKRVKGYDERILLDLVRFFIEVQRGRSWESDRIDKVDYLVTRLAESVAGEGLAGDRSRLSRVLSSLCERVAPLLDVDPQKVANRQRMIQAVRQEIRQIESLDDLTERDLVGHYRQVKHGLGSLLLERSILPAIVDTNVALTRRIRSFAEEEEQRILRDYEKIAKLEEAGIVDRRLADSVNKLHQQVSRFRKQVGTGNVRLQDMALIRQSVLEILERIEEPSGRQGVSGDVRLHRLDVARAIPVSEERKVIGEVFGKLIDALGQSGAGGGESTQARGRALEYRLEARELRAFDRLAGPAECDEDLEQFILASAALRYRINTEVEKIHSTRSRLGEEEDSQADDTTAVLDVGSLFLRRFDHELEAAVLRGRESEARELQLLRMRLMRDYSGLWLVAHA